MNVFQKISEDGSKSNGFTMDEYRQDFTNNTSPQIDSDDPVYLFLNNYNSPEPSSTCSSNSNINFDTNLGNSKSPHFDDSDSGISSFTSDCHSFISSEDSAMRIKSPDCQISKSSSNNDNNANKPIIPPLPINYRRETSVTNLDNHNLSINSENNPSLVVKESFKALNLPDQSLTIFKSEVKHNRHSAIQKCSINPPNEVSNKINPPPIPKRQVKLQYAQVLENSIKDSTAPKMPESPSEAQQNDIPQRPAPNDFWKRTKLRLDVVDKMGSRTSMNGDNIKIEQLTDVNNTDGSKTFENMDYDKINEKGEPVRLENVLDPLPNPFNGNSNPSCGPIPTQPYILNEKQVRFCVFICFVNVI